MTATGQVRQPTTSRTAQGNGGQADSQRERIRLAAVQLFTRQGYAGTSMKQLANALGMVPANLYNYYPKKEAILFEVLSHQLINLLDRDSKIVAQNPDPVARLHAFAYDLVIEDLRDPLAAFVGQHGVSGLARAGRDHISQLMAQVREMWAGAVEEGVSLGVFDSPDSKLATLTILTLCSSTSSWYNPGREFTEEDIAEYTAISALRIVGHSVPPAKRRSRGGTSRRARTIR